MKSGVRILVIAAVIAVATSAYAAESSRHTHKQSTVPGASAPVSPPASAAVPPTAPVTSASQAAVPPTQTPVMPTQPAIVPTDPAIIPPPQGNIIQGTTPPQ